MRPLLASIAIAAAILATAPLAAKERKAPPAAPMPAPNAPRLIVAISVDQYSADLFARYRRFYRAGLMRLQEGAVFPSGFQSHAATETCPGHSTLLTGVHPARTGIIANTWFEPAGPRGVKPIYCAEDERDPKSSAKDPVVSAWHLKVPTLGERIKAAYRGSRNVAVSAKDRAVMMMGGHDIDAAYWWKSGAFVTLTGRKLAPEAEAANASAAAAIKAGAAAYTPPAWCAPRDRAVAVGQASVGTGHFAMAAGADAGFRASPRMDAAVADLAIALANGMKLGRGKVPDVLSVSFSATDYVGHTYGTEGVEMCIQQAELDQSIGRLLDSLDAAGIDYAVVLSADHGGFDLPERLDQQALPAAAHVDGDFAPAKLAAAVTERTGIAVSGDQILSDGANGDYYISRALGADDRAKVVAALADILKAHPQVAAVFAHDEIAAVPVPSGAPQDLTLLQRARESFDAARSGDLVVLLKRAVVPIAEGSKGYVATHGSPWDYDRRVPMLFWRRGLAGFEQPSPVETVDIAPTLAALLGLKVPAGDFDGRCLDLDGGEGDTCSAGK
jgi:predicted AlkP superfamily pyrophosphatase or phosphodiesterase